MSEGLRKRKPTSLAPSSPPKSGGRRDSGPQAVLHRPWPTGGRSASPEPEPAHPWVKETDFLDAAYSPHTITVGIILFTALFSALSWYRSVATEESNIRFGLLASALAFLAFSAIHMPDSLLVRPHPAVWRFWLGVAVLYLVFAIFMSFQKLSTAQMLVNMYDSSLGTPRPEPSYAEDCRISTPEEPYKFWTTVFDEFVLAHLLGYWAKTVVIRDWRIVTAVSLGFEVCEVTFQHLLPNFKECWWDHLLIDVFGCNLLGTLLGLLTLHLVGAKRYHWVKLADIPTVGGKAKRMLTQFRPREMTKYEWNMFDSPKRFFQVFCLLAVMFVQEVNAFTMKNMLHIPSSHILVPGRLAMWGFIALVGLREFYTFVSDPTCKRLGTTAWVGTFALFFETFFLGKWIIENKMYRDPWPAHIAVPWIATIAIFVTWAALFFLTLGLRKGSLLWRCVLNLLFYSCPVILTLMCAMGNVDVLWKTREFDSWAAKSGVWW